MVSLYRVITGNYRVITQIVPFLPRSKLPPCLPPELYRAVTTFPPKNVTAALLPPDRRQSKTVCIGKEAAVAVPSSAAAQTTVPDHLKKTVVLPTITISTICCCVRVTSSSPIKRIVSIFDCRYGSENNTQPTTRRQQSTMRAFSCSRTPPGCNVEVVVHTTTRSSNDELVSGQFGQRYETSRIDRSVPLSSGIRDAASCGAEG